MTSLTLRQEQALAITPKFTAFISIPCSVFIIYEVCCDHRTGKANAIQRILLGMSVLDITSSVAWFLSTWAVPKGQFAFSTGNRASCTFQGFLLQLAIGPPLYNCSLALFYLLMIKHRWTDAMLHKLEYWVHGFILLFSVGTSIALLPLQQYNHVGAVCWVIGDPADCGHSSFHSSNVPCERGDHAYLYGMFLFYGPLWVCIAACVSSMIVIYREVRHRLRRMSRYSISGRVNHAMRSSEGHSSRVAEQAILYSVSFLITWMPSTLWSIAHWFNWSHFGLDYAAALCEPLQGLWNLWIFARHRKNSIVKMKKMVACFVPCVYTYKANDSEDLARSRGRARRFTSGTRAEQSTGSRALLNQSNFEESEWNLVQGEFSSKSESVEVAAEGVNNRSRDEQEARAIEDDRFGDEEEPAATTLSQSDHTYSQTGDAADCVGDSDAPKQQHDPDLEGEHSSPEEDNSFPQQEDEARTSQISARANNSPEDENEKQQVVPTVIAAVPRHDETETTASPASSTTSRTTMLLPRDKAPREELSSSSVPSREALAILQSSFYFK